jgi:hypothetical protein
MCVSLCSEREIKVVLCVVLMSALVEI